MAASATTIDGGTFASARQWLAAVVLIAARRANALDNGVRRLAWIVDDPPSTALSGLEGLRHRPPARYASPDDDRRRARALHEQRLLSRVTGSGPCALARPAPAAGGAAGALVPPSTRPGRCGEFYAAGRRDVPGLLRLGRGVSAIAARQPRGARAAAAAASRDPRWRWRLRRWLSASWSTVEHQVAPHAERGIGYAGSSTSCCSGRSASGSRHVWRHVAPATNGRALARRSNIANARWGIAARSFGTLYRLQLRCVPGLDDGVDPQACGGVCPGAAALVAVSCAAAGGLPRSCGSGGVVAQSQVRFASCSPSTYLHPDDGWR